MSPCDLYLWDLKKRGKGVLLTRKFSMTIYDTDTMKGRLIKPYSCGHVRNFFTTILKSILADTEKSHYYYNFSIFISIDSDDLKSFYIHTCFYVSEHLFFSSKKKNYLDADRGLRTCSQLLGIFWGGLISFPKTPLLNWIHS